MFPLTHTHFLSSFPPSALQVRRNVLDVSYHVSQYQNIISELKEEIDRLKGKLEGGREESAGSGAAPLSQEAKEEQQKNAERLKKIKNDLLDLFREQMSLRWVLCFPACLLTCLYGGLLVDLFGCSHAPPPLSSPPLPILAPSIRLSRLSLGKMKHHLPPSGTS